MAEPGLPPPGRREFLLRSARAAGLAPLALALLEGRALATPPRGDGADLEVLSASIALEHHAIALYDLGLQRGLVPAGLRHYALEFRGDHQGHRDTQILLMRERGSEPPAAQRGYDFGPLRRADELLRQALLIERAAQDAYLALISRIRTSDYLLSAAFILADEVRHLTVWQRALGQALY